MINLSALKENIDSEIEASKRESSDVFRCGMVLAEIVSEALEQARKAVCKQTPTKVTHEASLYKCCTCPDCKNVVDEFEQWGDRKIRIQAPFCRYCGQALDWSEE